MDFWGVEVRPGNPVTHSFNEVRRRLRITQATLGIGTAREASFVQCTVGNRSPVFICALLPEGSEICVLDLEFEEADDVIFSVIGPRSVSLTGFYVGNHLHSAPPGDSESYDEDIESTVTEELGYNKDTEEYEHSLINNGGVIVSPHTPISNNGVTEEKVAETKDERTGNRRLRRKIFLSSNSDKQTASLLSENEEKALSSVLMEEMAPKPLGLEVTEEKTDEVNSEIKESVNTTNSGTAVHVSEEKFTAATFLQNITSETDFDLLADYSQLERHKRENKEGETKKNKENVNESLLSAGESEKPLSNGLVIEELAVGNQDGKVAALGRKVKVYYTGMLKESGHVIDSNIGKAPYKFRLGEKEIIEGWNVGIEGMRVGDKRRLTIPPQMGYGEKGDGDNVPANSWLVFDIELVRVR